MFDTLLNTFASWGYAGITILMAIESSFVPLPSELVLPPAGYLASLGQMNVFIIILCSMAGSVVGALFNYFLALKLGSPLIHKLARSKWAKYFLVNPEKLAAAEEYFRHNGRSSTFIGRLIPGVRHLISIPAGLAKMPLSQFIGYTALGATIWSTVLVVLGWFFGANRQILMSHYHEVSVVAGGLFLIFLIYLAIKYYGQKKEKSHHK